MGYYTNPLVRISLREAQELAWKNFHALRIPYTRGFVYLIKINAEIREASNGSRSLDDIVRSLKAQKQRNRPCGIRQWLDLLKAEIGEESAVGGFHSMISGSPISLPPDCLGPHIQLIRNDQEVLDFGFDDASFTTRIIVGLKAQTRAAECGINDGDLILHHTPPWSCAEDFQKKMAITVRRSGQDMQFVYWPRTWEKAESWQGVEK